MYSNWNIWYFLQLKFDKKRFLLKMAIIAKIRKKEVNYCWEKPIAMVFAQLVRRTAVVSGRVSQAWGEVYPCPFIFKFSSLTAGKNLYMILPVEPRSRRYENCMIVMLR
jgi:hypothetical protein